MSKENSTGRGARLLADSVEPSSADPMSTVDADDESKLSEADLERVRKYLSSPVHQVERKPFRPWFMMGMLVLVVVLLGGLSQLIAWVVLEYMA